MPINFNCPACDAPIRGVQDDTAGRPAKCKKCGAHFRVPTVPTIKDDDILAILGSHDKASANLSTARYSIPEQTTDELFTRADQNDSPPAVPEKQQSKRVLPETKYAKVTVTNSRPLKLSCGSVMGICFSRDSRYLVVCGGGIVLWDVQANGERPLEASTPYPYSAVSVSPDGSVIAAYQYHYDSMIGGIDLFEINTGKRIGVLSLPQGMGLRPDKAYKEIVPLNSLIAFSPDGSRFFSGSIGGCILQWKLTPSIRNEATTGINLPGDFGKVTNVATATKANVMVCGNDLGEVFLCNKSRVCVLPNQGENNSVNPVAISPAGDLVASQPNFGTVIIWDAVSQSPKRTLRMETDEGMSLLESLAVLALAFSPNGRELAATLTDGTVRVWEVGTGIERLKLKFGRDDYIHSVVFSPDGTLLAAANRNTIKIWATNKGQAMVTLTTGMCFIATAAAGSSSAWEVESLRRFRDTMLMNYQFGRRFVELYEQLSPPVALWLSRRPVACCCVRFFAVWPVALFVNIVFGNGSKIPD